MKLKNIAILAVGSAFFIGCQSAPEQEQQEEASQEQQPTQQQMQEAIGQQPQAVQPEDVSEEELQQVASAIMKMQVFNQQIQQKMIDAVELKGLNAQRYTEIQQSQHNPDQDINATAEEMTNFEAANEELMKIQMEAQQQMEGIIAEEGLSMERYEGIAMLIQQNPEMQQKFQQIMQQMNQ